MRIGVNDRLQLPFLRAVPPIAVRVVTPDEAFIRAPDVDCRGAVVEAEGTKCLWIAEAGPFADRRAGTRFGGEQVLGIAEGEGFAAPWRCGAFPAGEGGLRFVDLVGAEAVEEIIADVEGADMFEAQELPAGIGPRRTV